MFKPSIANTESVINTWLLDDWSVFVYFYFFYIEEEKREDKEATPIPQVEGETA